MPEPEQLWRKEAHHFTIDIKVGAAWVRHASHQTESAALADVDTVLRDPSVASVKVEEHRMTHTCSLVFEDNSPSAIRLPPKLKPTGQSAPCPRCSIASQVASDGTNEWVFCGKCDSAFPV